MAISWSVQPLMADETTTVLSFVKASLTISMTLFMFWAFATELPPNFITCIIVVPLNDLFKNILYLLPFEQESVVAKS